MKTPEQTLVIMTELVLPSHTNTFGNVFGGVVMSWIDIAAAIAAGKHARKPVVTASIDALHFLAPIKQGYYVHIKAQVNFASRTSMEVGVRVDCENPITGETKRAVTAYTTFVALGENGKPSAVPELVPQTKEEIRRHKGAQKRKDTRIELAKALKAQNETES